MLRPKSQAHSHNQLHDSCDYFGIFLFMAEKDFR